MLSSSTRAVGRRLLHTTGALGCKERNKDKPVPAPEEAGWAFNQIEKKKGMFKPKHSVEEQIAYMQSKAFADAYKGLPIYHSYKRNFKGQSILQPPPRLFCIDKHNRFNVNNACPVCRDEYLFFDFQNPSLILQFLNTGTHQPIAILKTGLCREQYANLQAQLLAAKEHGECTITFGIDFRNFDFRNYYSWWTEEPGEPVSRAGLHLEDIHPDPLVAFPAHKPDKGNDWDQWWLRHDKFARKAK